MLQVIASIWQKYGYVYIQGAWGTVYIAVLTVVFGTILGTLLTFVRLSRSKILQNIIKAYVWVLRGTPALLQIYFFYFFVPKYIPFEMSERACIILALVVNASAYVEEVIRAGIEAVDRGQTEAARSLGMTPRHTMFRIIMPQAIKNILPALGNEFIDMIKEASLASIFFIVEITSAFKTVQSATFITIPALMISGAEYLLLTTLLSQLMKLVEKRLKRNDSRQ